MKVIVDFASYASIIEFTPFLGEDIEVYQKAFEDWYYERANGGHLLQKRSDLEYTVFNADVIIDWIKEVSPSSNPIILQRTINFMDIDRTIPAMCF